MPIGPEGQKRPADVVGNAVKVMHIATGQEEEIIEGKKKDPAAQALGSKGGRKRAASLSPERRKEIARKAAKKRWEKKDDSPD